MAASDSERDPKRIPTTASLRLLIDEILVGDSDLEAFCLDFFPRVKKRFSTGMERKIKVSLLLEQEDRTEILAYLRKDRYEAFARHAHLVEYAIVREEERPLSGAAEELLDFVHSLAPLRAAEPRLTFMHFITPLHAQFDKIHLEYVRSFNHLRRMLLCAGDQIEIAVATVKDQLMLSEPQRIKVRAAVEVFTDVVCERDPDLPRINQMRNASGEQVRWQGVFRFEATKESMSKASAIFMPYCDSVYRYLTVGHDDWLSWDGGLWEGMSQRWHLSILEALRIAHEGTVEDDRYLKAIVKGTSLSLKDRDKLGIQSFAIRLVDSLAVMCQGYYADAVREYVKLASNIPLRDATRL